MKAVLFTGTLAVFIVIYSWVLVFSVVRHTQKRIDEAVAQEQQRCDLRVAELKASLSVKAPPQQTEPSAVQTTDFPTVSFEARAASRAKYVEGLNYFNQDDYSTARQLWLEAVTLDPENAEAQLGLNKVEELLKE